MSKNYPNGTTAVDGLSLELAEGGLTVLVGPSGCGKTTTLRMVNRMVEPSAGTVSLRGQDIRQVAAPELRRGIGYVIQHAGLFPHRTVLDNVATVPLLLGWGKKKARSRAAELLELVGLPATMAKRYPYQLSGGQQQRVGVARALGADPPVLLMDEPFSAVDPIVRGELQAEFLRLQKELHKTIVFVTHDIDEAIKLGDHIAVFRTGGKLAQFDTPERLLAHPADDFVADFVGQDRGIRRLSFVQASGLPLREGPVLPVTASVAAARGLDEPWVLAVDAARRPLGWAAVGGLPAAGTLADAELAPLGHTFSLVGDSARAALDAALLSPSRLAVGVDAEGRVAGVADAYELSAAMGGTSTVTDATAGTPKTAAAPPGSPAPAGPSTGSPAPAGPSAEAPATGSATAGAPTAAGTTAGAPAVAGTTGGSPAPADGTAGAPVTADGTAEAGVPSGEAAAAETPVAAGAPGEGLGATASAATEVPEAGIATEAPAAAEVTERGKATEVPATAAEASEKGQASEAPTKGELAKTPEKAGPPDRAEAAPSGESADAAGTPGMGEGPGADESPEAAGAAGTDGARPGGGAQGGGGSGSGRGGSQAGTGRAGSGRAGTGNAGGAGVGGGER